MGGKRKRDWQESLAIKKSRLVEKEDPIDEFSSGEEAKVIFEHDSIESFSEEENRPRKRLESCDSEDPIEYYSSDSEDLIEYYSSEISEEEFPVNVRDDSSSDEESIISRISESEEDSEDIDCVLSALNKHHYSDLRLPSKKLNEESVVSITDRLSSSEELSTSNVDRSSSSGERLASSEENSPLLQGSRQDLIPSDLPKENSMGVSTSMMGFFSKNMSIEKIKLLCSSQNSTQYSLTQNK